MKSHPQQKFVPKEKWIPEADWKKVTESIPLACVDIVFQRKDCSVLVGWRMIEPYRNVWALPGGRMLYRENLKQTAERIAHQYGLIFEKLYLIGVFPVNFQKRSDITIGVAATSATGEPIPDGYELSKFSWVKALPRNSGANYRRIAARWKRANGSTDYLQLNRIL